MKAILNKKFDLFVSVVDYLWSKRNTLRKEYENELGLESVFEYPSYYEYGKNAGKLSGDVIDAIQESFWRLAQSCFTTKNQFLKDILQSPSFSFYDEFVKKIE